MGSEGAGCGMRAAKRPVLPTFKRLEVKDDKKISLSTLSAGEGRVENEKRCCKNNCTDLALTT